MEEGNKEDIDVEIKPCKVTFQSVTLSETTVIIVAVISYGYNNRLL